MAQTDPEVVNMMKQLHRQAIGRQRGSIELIGEGSTTPVVDLVPPPVSKADLGSIRGGGEPEGLLNDHLY